MLITKLPDYSKTIFLQENLQQSNLYIQINKVRKLSAGITTKTGFEIDRAKITLPANGKKCLLHVCCAPCSGEVIEALEAESGKED